MINMILTGVTMACLESGPWRVCQLCPYLNMSWSGVKMLLAPVSKRLVICEGAGLMLAPPSVPSVSACWCCWGSLCEEESSLASPPASLTSLGRLGSSTEDLGSIFL